MPCSEPSDLNRVRAAKRLHRVQAAGQQRQRSLRLFGEFLTSLEALVPAMKGQMQLFERISRIAESVRIDEPR